MRDGADEVVDFTEYLPGEDPDQDEMWYEWPFCMPRENIEV